MGDDNKWDEQKKKEKVIGLESILGQNNPRALGAQGQGP